MAYSSNPSYVVKLQQLQYPYPSHVYVPTFVSVKLSGKDDYLIWKQQMICLMESHDMLGFVDGTFVIPKNDAAASLRKGKDITETENNRYRQWRRSDSLLKGWILGSLSNNLLRDFVQLQTAKDLWSKLEADYGSVILPPSDSTNGSCVEEVPKSDQQDPGKSTKEEATPQQPPHPPPLPPQPQLQPQAQPLPPRPPAEAQPQPLRREYQKVYEATLQGDWWAVKYIFEKEKVDPTTKITIDGNTALHIAIGTSQKISFVEKLVRLIPSEKLVDLKNSYGRTPLHVAAINGNTAAAKLLVPANRKLLDVQDKRSHTPLTRALIYKQIDTFLYLLQVSNPNIDLDGRQFSYFNGAEVGQLLVNAICAKKFATALYVVNRFPTLAGRNDEVLVAVVKNFPRELAFFERLTYSCLQLTRNNSVENFFQFCVSFGQPSRIAYAKFVLLKGFYSCLLPLALVFAIVVCWLCALVWGSFITFWKFAALVPTIKRVEDRGKMYLQAKELLSRVCYNIKFSQPPSSYSSYYERPIVEAACGNVYECVEEIVSYFPDAIWSSDVNGDGHNIIELAIINRSEKVYNLVYQMSERRNYYREHKDSFQNSILHLAARLAPSHKLDLIPGAALQLQRELRWYKEVEKFVFPPFITSTNTDHETPKMIFSNEHTQLMKQGEKWMKATANSYTITATLITTIVFAAAITVPGGNNQDTGVPIFSRETAFTVFVITDAVSLLASTTSLLMFLSILTARYMMEDFILSLPRRLIIGLATLFISTTTMMIAFSMTLFILYGEKKAWIMFPIATSTCLPIISFMTLQFPLLVDLIRLTYGRVFGRQSNHTFYFYH